MPENHSSIAIYFIVFEGKSASARECCFPEKMMKYVALNARFSPFQNPTTFFSTFFAVFKNEHLKTVESTADCLRSRSLCMYRIKSACLPATTTTANGLCSPKCPSNAGIFRHIPGRRGGKGRGPVTPSDPPTEKVRPHLRLSAG